MKFGVYKLGCNGEYYYVRWSVGKIQEDTEKDSFIPYIGTDETAFWKSEGNMLYINGARFAKAYQELEEEGYVCDREGERMAASEKQIAELIRKELLQEFDTVVIRLQNMSVRTEELTGRMWKLAGGSKDFD